MKKDKSEDFLQYKPSNNLQTLKNIETLCIPAIQTQLAYLADSSLYIDKKLDEITSSLNQIIDLLNGEQK